MTTIPREMPAGAMQKHTFSGTWGEGGDPHPPCSLFFKWGIPSPHVPGQQGGTPSLSGPGRAIPIKTPEFTNRSLYAGDSTRTTGFGHAKKDPVAGKGGRGVTATPPALFFSGGGYPPPLRALAGSGHHRREIITT